MTLQLRLFGKFHAAAGETPIDDFATEKVRALLAYLAAEADRPFPRAHLATLLWSEWEERAALSNLRKTLFRLRQTLAQEVPDIAEQCLTVTRTAVTFHTAVAEVDKLILIWFKQLEIRRGQRQIQTRGKACCKLAAAERVTRVFLMTRQCKLW